MANYKTVFIGDCVKGDDAELECFANTQNKIRISISVDGYEDYALYIDMDRSTAIKLSKTLKTEISMLESEVDNG